MNIIYQLQKYYGYVCFNDSMHYFSQQDLIQWEIWMQSKEPKQNTTRAKALKTPFTKTGTAQKNIYS